MNQYDKMRNEVARLQNICEKISGSNAELLEALKGIYQLIQDGDLQRNTSNDGSPDYTKNILAFTLKLSKADQAIKKAEAK